MDHYCIHEADWGKVMEAIETIKQSSRDAVKCQGELKALIIESQKLMAAQSQKIKDMPSPGMLRFYAILSGGAVALVSFAIYKFS